MSNILLLLFFLVFCIMFYIRSCLLRELTASKLIVILNRLALTQIFYQHTMYVMGIYQSM